MKTKTLFLSEANFDIDEAFAYEVQSRPTKAKKVVQAILKNAAEKQGVSLANLTNKNPIMPEIDYRAMVVEGYAIIYREEGDTRYVNRVLNLQRDLGNITKYFV